MPKTTFFSDEQLFKEKEIVEKLASMKDSRQQYALTLALFGRDGLPSSVMKAERTKVDIAEDEHGAVRSYSKSSVHVKDGSVNKYPKEFKSARVISGSGAARASGKNKKESTLSTFPQKIGRSILLLYSKPGDTVFDPFAGHNSRMSLCVKERRNYIGCDLSGPFMKFNFIKAEELRSKYPMVKIELHHTDSRKVPIKSGVGDFTITSPPYWNIEFYGDEPEQMYFCKTYEEFLKGIKKVLAENFRVLKPGSFAVWFINDFRKKGKMFFYHADIIWLAEEVGFEPHDIMITDFGRGFRDVFIMETMRQKILPKRHEYGVVLRKPE